MSNRMPDSITCRADVDALLATATNYEEKLPRDPLRQALDLDRVRSLFASIGDPQIGPRTVHVAGSKGKGTVARMIAAGLRRAGRGPVGLYTSPHLEDLTERISVDGEPVTEAPLARAADGLLPHLRTTRGTPDAPTFFEIFTAIAWLVFREAGCTDVVLETGLGGRLDATNVCVPALTVITQIELEHTRLLGDTLEAVAAEKAGIIKAGVPVLTYNSAAPVAVAICRRAEEVGAPFRSVGGLLLAGRLVVIGDLDGPLVTSTDRALPGLHHPDNAAAAYIALRMLGVDEETAWAGLASTELPGILEEVATKPLVIIDGAHTVASAEGTRRAVAERRPEMPMVLLLAMLEEKDTAGVAAALVQDVSHVVTTQVSSPRAIPADELAATVRSVWDGEVEAQADLAAALARARALAGERGLVLATGSVYLAGAVKTLTRGPS